MLVPVKAFRDAKVRLALALAPEERERLTREWAEGVLRAAEPLPVSVVCDDAEVAAWAQSKGARVIWSPDRGLNGAVATGVEQLAAEGATQVIVAHADLPLATDLGWVADFAGVTLVPDRREDGTNVLCVPTGSGFVFSYGPGSFSRHQAEALARQLPLRVVRQPLLAWDVDTPGDLDFSSAPA